MKAIHRKRLENLARILREAAARKLDFDMGQWGFAPDYDHDKDEYVGCGTPACALGHYAARRDVQGRFNLTKEGNVSILGRVTDSCLLNNAALHFGMSNDDAVKMFGGNEYDGHNKAKTPAGAAQYVERYLARQLKAA